MRFITVSKLNRDIVNNIHRIPSNVDLVVGVPRSGMLVANLIALYLNKPVADLSTYCSGTYYSIGNTKNRKGLVDSFEKIRDVLIVEDSVSSGKSIGQVKEEIKAHEISHRLTFLAAYVFSDVKDLVDISFECIDEDRVFEWNYLHHPFLEKACFDIDGVLCLDPSDEQNDDGSNYCEFLRNVDSKLVPSRRIGHLVTSRLEKYRTDTEKWLRDHNIEYNELHMMNLTSADERRLLGNHAAFKAEIYKKFYECTWFVESDPIQAQEISEISGKLVFCVNNHMCYPDNSINRVKTVLTQGTRHKLKAFIKRITPAPVWKCLKRLKRNHNYEN